MATHRDFRSFRKAMIRRADQIDRNASRDIRALALNVMSNLIQNTPVKTGRARGAWFAEINSPNLTVSERLDKSGNETLSRAASSIASYTLKDKSIYITNNVFYVPLLDKGTSRRAPLNFVRKSIATASSQLRGFNITG